MSTLKGSTYLARLAFLDQKYEEDDRRRVFATLPEQDIAILQGKILPGSWYPRDVFTRLVEGIDQVLGDGDYRLVRKMGYFAADLQLSSVYSSFIRPGDPSFLMNKAGSAWGLFHTYGRIESRLEAPFHASLIVRELGYPDITTVEGVIGWSCRGLEMSGCTDIRFRYKPLSSAAGDAFHILIVWKMADKLSAEGSKD